MLWSHPLPMPLPIPSPHLAHSSGSGDPLHDSPYPMSAQLVIGRCHFPAPQPWSLMLIHDTDIWHLHGGGGGAQGDQSKLPIVRVQRVPIRALLKQNKRKM